MKMQFLVPALLGAMLLAAGAVVQAAERVDIGKQEYDGNCAVCHGTKGKGDGSYGELLKTKVPDLTTLAKRNGGVFPVAQVYEVIDGRRQTAAHGSREMPVWGADYIAKAEHYGRLDAMGYDPDAYVRFRILSLIDYLYRLQAK